MHGGARWSEARAGRSNCVVAACAVATRLECLCMSFFSLVRPALAITACIFAAACTVDAVEKKNPTPAPTEKACAQSDIDDCLVNQKSCSMSSGSAACVACSVGH